MSKKIQERQDGGGTSWLPIVVAFCALGLGFVAWTDAKKVKDETLKRFVDMDTKVIQLQAQVANAAKAKPAPQQGPDPNKVYTVRTEGSPTKGNPKAPIIIAAFSEFQ